jgi:hypothetical protein
MNFNNFSPSLLRFAIEIELQSTNDAKVAAMTAISRLRKDPDYYTNKYGFVEPVMKARPTRIASGPQVFESSSTLEKAKMTKYIFKKPDGKGGWIYTYTDDFKNGKKKAGTEEIKLRMRFDAHGLIHKYEYAGYSERVGDDKTSEKALNKAKEFEDSISDYSKEHTLVLNENGDVILDKIGDYEEIDLGKEHESIRKAEILTHTHSEDKSFSAEDIFLALSLGIKELRVKTPTNTYYFKISHKEKSKTEYGVENKNRSFMNTIININDKLISHYIKTVRKGLISQTDAEKEHRELLWEAIAESPILSDNFNIEYGKVKK